MLIQAAAKQWSVPVAEVTAVNHTLTHAKSGRTLGYGAVAQAAAELPVPTDVKLKDPKDFRYIGTGKIGLIDNFDITTGKAIYGLDTKLDGMLYAVVARPAVYGGTVKSFDDSEAKKVPGVVKIFKIDATPIPTEFMPLGGVAVVAKNTWAALKARDALKITWDDGPNAGYDTDAFRKELEAAARKPGKVVRNQGDVDGALAKAKTKVQAEYFVPHLAQAPMEPPAAVARVKDGFCEAWACVQGPQAANDRLMKALKLPDDKVKVNVTLLGGGFGPQVQARLRGRGGALLAGRRRRAGEARLDPRGRPPPRLLPHDLGGASGGRPRRERHAGGVAAPLGGADDRLDLRARSEARAAVRARDGSGQHAAQHPEHAAGEPRGRRPCPGRLVPLGVEHPARLRDPVLRVGAGARRRPRAEGVPARPHRPRSQDQPDRDRRRLELRRGPEALPDRDRPPARRDRGGRQGRGWGREMPKGSGLGVAGHYSFVTYTAVAAEVEVDDKGQVKVKAIDIAVDCGPQVNPERIRSQMEGAVVMGWGSP